MSPSAIFQLLLGYNELSPAERAAPPISARVELAGELACQREREREREARSLTGHLCANFCLPEQNPPRSASAVSAFHQLQ